jgi:hypothetical protein
MLTDGSFDVCWSQFGHIHPPSDIAAFEMAGHGAAVDTELPGEVVQGTAALVPGRYGCNFRGDRSTLDWPQWTSRSSTCGGRVVAIDVCTESLSLNPPISRRSPPCSVASFSLSVQSPDVCRDRSEDASTQRFL